MLVEEETVVSAFCVKNTVLMEAQMGGMVEAGVAHISVATLRSIPFYT